MKKMEYSPQLRNTALRLLEMWNIINVFSADCDDKIKMIENHMMGFSSSFIRNLSTSGTTNRVLEGLCKIETVLERKKIADRFDLLMNTAWSKLSERDKTVLTPYRKQTGENANIKEIYEFYSVTRSCLHIYRDCALKHLWYYLSETSEKMHQLLFDLFYKWLMGEYWILGRRLHRLCVQDYGCLESELKKTDIPIVYQEKKNVDTPYICIEPSYTISGNKLNPDSVHVTLINKKRDIELEKKVEDLLKKSQYIFQIYRFRVCGKSYRYKVVYEFPLEQEKNSYQKYYFNDPVLARQYDNMQENFNVKNNALKDSSAA